ncbi:MAG: four helix bundle protein [Candidatus Latescibacteria bacterium]|nr:four helix bundle protein [Candidatus Latescibacterota bacterium]
MAKIERFEDIEAWKKARVLTNKIYGICRTDNFRKDYDLINQMKRASVSVMANIAEGFARRTNKELINFLGMAHGSVAELQSHLYVALDQKYLARKDFSILYDEANGVSKLIQGFVNYLKKFQTQKLLTPNPKTPKLSNSLNPQTLKQ